jgi:MATE family multidrug resistance protein
VNLSQYFKEFHIILNWHISNLGMLGHTLIGIVDNFMVGNWSAKS